MQLNFKECLKTISLITLLSVTTVSLANVNPPISFDGAEHIAIGDSIKLSLRATDAPKTGVRLQLPNLLNVTYGEIIALGDFYGNINQPISQGETEKEQNRRFLSSFYAFAYDRNVIPEVEQILEILVAEKTALEEAVKNGQDPEEVSKKLILENNRKLNCITGGGCEGMWYLKPGRYLQLGRTNFDHFGDQAWTTYQIGHKLAINEAMEAGKKHDTKRLMIAYAMNAFACHFLSDRFASGHIRVPRVELPEMVTPALSGSLLAGFMHIEENAYGLHVHNKLGERWIVYGDHGYYTRKNELNRLHIRMTLQQSADEVFYAFKYGVQKIEDLSLNIPFPDEVDTQNYVDISPLFYFDKETKQLLRREDIANPYDRHWTTNWWAWSTLILLSEHYGIPPEAQALLYNSPLRAKAVKDHLITNKALLSLINKS